MGLVPSFVPPRSLVYAQKTNFPLPLQAYNSLVTTPIRERCSPTRSWGQALSKKILRVTLKGQQTFLWLFMEIKLYLRN